MKKQKPEQFEFEGGEIGKALSHYSIPELRIMRDALEAEIAKAEPKLADLIDTIVRCAPKQEAAAYTAALAVCPKQWRRRLRTLRLIAAYTHAMELKAQSLSARDRREPFTPNHNPNRGANRPRSANC